MRHRLEPHVLRGLRGERRAPAAVAEEDEALVLGEHRLVVRALRIEPEFQHAARAVEGAGNAAVAVELADVAQIHEHDVAAAVELDRVLEAQRLDLAFRGVDQRPESRGDVLGHGNLARVAHILPDAAAQVPAGARRIRRKPTAPGTAPRSARWSSTPRGPPIRARRCRYV